MNGGKALYEATPGIWMVGSCRTWTEEQRVLATIPLLMDLYEEVQRLVLAGEADPELERVCLLVQSALAR